MKRLTAILLMLLVLGISEGQAQRRRVAKKKQPEVIEETPQEKLFKSMVGNTAKVMFIDSLVVNRDVFLAHIPLSTEAGMMIAYNELFDKQGQDSSYVFANEFGTTCYYSEAANDSTRFLYSIDKLGKTWSQPRRLTELGANMQMANYPFLMTDGVTLFFAAKGEESLGGYDIFMTRYNADGAHFYTPENYGLPFNSTANEYFLAIDDFNQLGYLVSDRNQPEGKVCIYTFEPTKSRTSFEADNIDEEQLKSFARLDHIKDTWRFGNRAEALRRINQLAAGKQRSSKTDATFSFIINDQTVYHSLADFRSKQAQQLCSEYLTSCQNLDKAEQALEQQREAYGKLPISQRQSLRAKILQAEKDVRQTRAELNTLAKRIRQIESNSK